jgi:hypothetical protein
LLGALALLDESVGVLGALSFKRIPVLCNLALALARALSCALLLRGLDWQNFSNVSAIDNLYSTLHMTTILIAKDASSHSDFREFCNTDYV